MALNKIFNDNSQTIGNTPLVRINRLANDNSAIVLAKIEGRNPAFSVKCRVGAAMIWAAESKGILKPNSDEVTVIEPTSGNTGIALAFVCASRGYRLILTMPDTMSLERRRMLKAFGAELVLTEGSKGMKGAIAKAEEIMSENPDAYFMPNQFSNPANPEIHYKTTGPEIFNDTNGQVDMVVCGIGTGGTISGVGRYLKKEKGLSVTMVGVEPEKSPVLTQLLAKEDLKPGPHKIQGIGAGFKPDNLNIDIVDKIEQVKDEEAIEVARNLHKQEGITCGISCGAAMAVALRFAKKPELKGKTIVVVLPDSGERYLSSVLFAD